METRDVIFIIITLFQSYMVFSVKQDLKLFPRMLLLEREQKTFWQRLDELRALILNIGERK